MKVTRNVFKRVPAQPTGSIQHNPRSPGDSNTNGVASIAGIAISANKINLTKPQTQPRWGWIDCSRSTQGRPKRQPWVLGRNPVWVWVDSFTLFGQVSLIQQEPIARREDSRRDLNHSL